MSLKNYFVYDTDTCNFVPVEYDPVERVIFSLCLWILGGVVSVGIGISLLYQSAGTPNEIALRAENKALVKQLGQTKSTINKYHKQLKDLAHQDNDLFRSMLGMAPISNDKREAGTGGADIYSNMDVYGKKAADILKWTKTNLKNIQRGINIQESSFKAIKAYYNKNKKKMSHIPAVRPVPGIIVSGFGMRFHPVLKVWRMHEGVDFRARVGTKVHATADGVVKFAGRDGTYGNLLIINDGFGFETYYAHLSAFPNGIKPGVKVKRGEVVALTGDTGITTGPHLHYEVHVDGQPVNPIYFLFADMTPSLYMKYKKMAESSTKSMD